MIAVNTIKHPAFAEELLENGVCDFVGVARGNLADPAWAKKAMEGRDEDIRKCLGCMECFRILNQGRALECTVNPILGRENEWGEDCMKKDGAGRPVAVIGGGPAGMQAAVVLAKRGFKVTLFEKGDKLGGTANLAAVPPFKSMIAEFVETQKAEVEAAGVDVRLNTPGTVEACRELGAVGVFLATGGSPIAPKLPGIEKAVTAESLLAGEMPKGKTIAVIGGGVTGLETAEWLCNDNKVSVIEMMDKVGGNLYPSVVMHLVQTIAKAGGAVMKGKTLAEIGDGEIKLYDSKTAFEETHPADLVVLAMGVRANRPDYEAFKEAYADRLVKIGDSDVPGQILNALHAAYDRAFVFEA